VTGAATSVDLPILVSAKGGWTRWLSRGFSVALLVVVVAQLGQASPAAIRAAMPDSPWFAPTLLALYLALPVADWIIFRRLWRLPVDGFPVLVGKRISNELLMMYSGEVYFYLWARRRTGLTTAPFGTIKDVNILSALAGNALALLLLAIAYPFVTELEMGRYANAALASAGVMLGGSMVILLASRRLFTLPLPRLAEIFAIHLARLVAGVLLCALLWHLALPDAPIGLWIALSTLRLLVGRLPLVPNKELLFAAIAAFLVGDEADVVALIGLTSTAMLLLHIVFGGAVALWALTQDGETSGKGEEAR